MVLRRLLRTLAALSIGTVVAGCGPQLQSQPPRTVPVLPAIIPAPVILPVAPPVDPVAIVIASSQQHFEAGQQEMQLGHLERAKAEFNDAIDVLLKSPYGARSDIRLREHFDRMVDRISTFEITALTEGDGFTEQKYQPAQIDQLLDLATFAHPTPPTTELAETVKSDLEKTAHDIPIPLNARVLAYIDLFQGRLRDWIQDGLRRGARYLPMIQNVFRAEGLPLDLAYVPLIESAFKPDAVSRAKAKGVWQFMQGTAMENGLAQNWYIDERSDPEKATLAAAKYLKSLWSLFSGDWHLALASYNGGPGRVQHAVTRTGGADFWKLADSSRYLPRETREYVPMILAAIVIARNPLEYGFTVPAEASMQYEKVRVTKAVDLRRVAEWTGVPVSEITDLNPELRRLTTPVTSDGYELKVPAGTAQAVAEKLDQAAADELALFNSYVVKRGESIATIARKLNVKSTDLVGANGLKSIRTAVTPGQRLMVPQPTTLLAARADRPEPPTASRRLVAGNAMMGEAPTATPSNDGKLIYRVKSGDTLSSVARLYNTTVASLKVWNHLRTTAIRPGDRLTIFARRSPVATSGSGR